MGSLGKSVTCSDKKFKFFDIQFLSFLKIFTLKSSVFFLKKVQTFKTILQQNNAVILLSKPQKLTKASHFFHLQQT